MRRDPRDTERQLWELASDQGGYFTASQALSVGYTYRQQHFHRERGNWLAVDRGLFRLRAFPTSEYEELIRWSFWSRDQSGKIQAVVSHESALDVHDLSDVLPSKLHFTVPKNFRKPAPRICILHYGEFVDADIEHRQGFLLTTPVRTIKDIAESDLSPEHLEKAIYDALRRGIVRRKQFEQNEFSAIGWQRIQEALRTTDRLAS